MAHLEVIFDHHLWATQVLIDHCGRLTKEQLAYSSPGTYGGILSTLTHLVAEDQRLFQRLTGTATEVPITEEAGATVEQLRRAWSTQSDHWRVLLPRIDEISATLPARGRWPEVRPAEELIVLEVVQHGNDHRTHVCSVLSAHDVEAPLLCGWMYWRETGRAQPKLSTVE